MLEKFIKKYPILYSLIVEILYLSIFSVFGRLLRKFMQEQDQFLMLAVLEFSGFIITAVIIYFSGLGSIFKNKGTGFKGLITGGYFIAAPIIASFGIISLNKDCQISTNCAHIVFYVVCMLLVGLTEESMFRGIIATTIYKKFAHKNNSGIVLTLIIQGLLFGLAHSINFMSVGMSFGVLIQILVAIAMGIALGSIYLRTGNIWIAAFLHGFNDICAGISTCLYDSSIANVIQNYTATNLIGIVPYVILVLVLLRKSKISSIPANFEFILKENDKEPVLQEQTAEINVINTEKEL